MRGLGAKVIGASVTMYRGLCAYLVDQAGIDWLLMILSLLRVAASDVSCMIASVRCLLEAPNGGRVASHRYKYKCGPFSLSGSVSFWLKR